MRHRLLALTLTLLVGIGLVLGSLAAAHQGRITATESGAAPTLTNCGNATIGGNDTAGRITFTTGATSCQVNFGKAFSTAPSCYAATETDTGANRATAWVTHASASTTILTITLEAEPGDTDTMTYLCIGR